MTGLMTTPTRVVAVLLLAIAIVGVRATLPHETEHIDGLQDLHDKDHIIEVPDEPEEVEVLPVSAVLRHLVYGYPLDNTTSSVRVKRQINFGGGGTGPTIQHGRPVSVANFPSRPNRPNGRPFNQQGGFNGGSNINFGGGGGGAPPSGQCGNCVSMAACSFVVAFGQAPSTCQTSDAAQGVCCPQTGAGSNTRRLFPDNKPQVALKPVSQQQVNHACQDGISFLQNLNRLESELISANKVVKRNTPERGHLKFFKVTETAKESHAKALQITEASRSMMNDLSLTRAQGGHGLRQLPVRQSILANHCPRIPQCNPRAKYRTIDGTCNNLANPLYGKSETAFNRILPPMYEDGVSRPRTKSVTGADLPFERVVASSILVDRNDPDQTFTLSVMQWAQFIDHDLTHAPFPSLPNGEGIECCSNGRTVDPSQTHPECWPIQIPADDPFYSTKGRTCMNFIRSMLGLNQDCTFGYAEQMNQITHWLDGSNVYGSRQEEATRLRTGQGGLLRLSQNNLLPIDQTSGGDCEARERGALCYHAGDSRVNEQPGLTAIHTLFHREHNRVARHLQQRNPNWSDEALYQEARRIVVAEMQHIIFSEWLPIIVGSRFMDSFGILPLQQGYSFDYNPQFNPNMNNEFATGAFRFGHSLVQGTITLLDEFNNMNTIRMREHFNSPHIFQQNPNVLDMFSRAFIRQAIQKFDSFVTDDLTNHLFQTPNQNFGMDLMSLNLHRGRDHAIASYNQIREVCGLRRAATFQDFNDQIPVDIVQRLSTLYNHPDDVDFFVGGMSEKPVSGGLLGWTFLCVVGDQFARLKKGDRFFYDLGGQPSSFSLPQVQELRKASWARILCDNSNNLRRVQPLAFLLPDTTVKNNPMLSCDDGRIPRVNLDAWTGETPQA